jgi:SnoaL-like domain
LREASRATLLARYFELLDARCTDELVLLFAPDGIMITRGGTAGEVVQGHRRLHDYYAGRGPSTVRHTITAASQSDCACFAEGLVKPRDGAGDIKFFLASAALDEQRRIKRYTTLVWPGITGDQALSLTGQPDGIRRTRPRTGQGAGR